MRPLDFSERVLSVNFRGDQNKVNGQNEYGNRYSFAYIDQFQDHRVGISIGYAHMVRFARIARWLQSGNATRFALATSPCR